MCERARAVLTGVAYETPSETEESRTSTDRKKNITAGDSLAVANEETRGLRIIGISWFFGGTGALLRQGRWSFGFGVAEPEIGIIGRAETGGSTGVHSLFKMADDITGRCSRFLKGRGQK